MNSHGFTLFELLVSISIIALLTAIAVVSFGGVNKKARDSKRKSDIGEISLALENYRQINGYYPSDLDTLVSNNLMQEVPLDPKDNVTSYCYIQTDYTYCLGIDMEIENSENDINCSCSRNYEINNP